MDTRAHRGSLGSDPLALEGTGLELWRSISKAKITAIDPPSKRVAHAIGRLRTTTAGLNARQARVLLCILNGEVVFHRNLSNQDELTLAR